MYIVFLRSVNILVKISLSTLITARSTEVDTNLICLWKK